MKNSKLFKTIIASLGTAALCSSMAIAIPQTAITAQAADSQGTYAPLTTGKKPLLRQDCISYVYKLVGHALYKHLYNYSTGNYIGDYYSNWIFVRNLNDEEYEKFLKLIEEQHKKQH